MNRTFEEFLLKTFGFYPALPKAPSGCKRGRKREVNGVLMQGIEVEISPQTE